MERERDAGVETDRYREKDVIQILRKESHHYFGNVNRLLRFQQIKNCLKTANIDLILKN